MLLVPQIYAEAERRTNLFALPRREQYMRRSRIYAEAECNANEFIHFALPRRNSICGAAEYTQKPRGEQIYLLYRGTEAYMDTRTNITPTNIFALLKCLNVAKDLLIVRHLACATSH